MNNEKIDSILNLSLETEEAVRVKSDILSNGYNPQTGIWEVIVKYHGDIAWMAAKVESLELLLNGFAIMKLSEAQLERIITEEQIEYVEKPKSFAFDIYQAKQRSCILPVTLGTPGLRGKNVLVAVLDSGIDYLLKDFQNAEGSRILYLWDQTLSENVENGMLAPAGFAEGVEFTKADIDRAIAAASQAGGSVNAAITQAGGSVNAAASQAGGSVNAAITQAVQQRNARAVYEVVPSRDITGHGTAVAGIAAGSSVSPLYQGVASESELIIVKLGGNRETAVDSLQAEVGQTNFLQLDSVQTGFVQAGSDRMNFARGESGQGSTRNFPLTTDIMRGITYVIRKAQELGKPVAINLSIGDTYGAHDGTSLLERFIDVACETGRNVICIGSGNEAVTGGHTSLQLLKEERVEIAIGELERSVNVQIWKNFVDSFTLELVAPGGTRYPVDLDRGGKQLFFTGNTEVLIYVSPPTPYSVNEEIFFDFVPVNSYIDSGIWTFILKPVGEHHEDIHFFLPNAVVRNVQTKFLQPTPYLSMTIPAFASRAITVAAYDTALNAYADFSGRDREIGVEESVFFASDVKPDLAAPGVGVTAPSSGGGYASFTGTSFATPIVTGSAALMMEWGIVRGNDRFLYGEKLKAYLRKGARPLLDERMRPNAKTGYGALCLAESIPE